MDPPRVRAAGEAGLVVEVPDAAAARALADALRERAPAGVVDVVPGLATVLLTVDPAAVDTAELAAAGRFPGDVPALPGSPHHRDVPGRRHELAVAFDGPDLETVASSSGLSVGEVVAALTTARLRVEVLGFVPGFAYLSGLPPALAGVPRRPTPRPLVPAGALALANGHAAVYPRASPGGWQLVGRSGRRLFDPSSVPPSLLSPGDEVRLVEVADPGSVPTEPAAGHRPAGGDPGVAVEVPGLCSLVQDAGRARWAHHGVPAAGPADPVAHQLANLLVGNAPWAPALEVAAAGPRLRFLLDAFVAVVGGDAVVAVDHRPLPSGAVVPVAAGQTLTVEPGPSSLRCTLAVAGAFRTPALLGSVATDTLSWTGPGPLRTGDVLGLAPGAAPLRGRLQGDPTRSEPGGTRVLRVLGGPHPGHFAPDVLATLAATTFRVGERCDRVGVRLEPEGGGPGVPTRGGELASEGTVAGAVQVPPDGVPIILGPDRATLGGYPAAAVVAQADLAVLGRCRPGDRVRLVPVSPAEAVRARMQLAGQMAGAVGGHYPRAAGT